MAKVKTFKVQIEAVVKGSFLQGGLYFAEEHWIKHFPEGEATRIFG